ncbi:helix-turn-helix domain-containing protein, partial [Yersinia pestis]|uniref:helix-turn-helix domain-containing protein n=2 Tax=Yersinia pestis TaxID=632 RepID=UPI0008FC0B99
GGPSDNISQPIFARYLNTRVSTIQKWETGAKHPSRTYIALGLLPSDKKVSSTKRLLAQHTGAFVLK